MTEKLAAEMTTEELFDYVMGHSVTGDPYTSLEDWLVEGDLTDETPDDVVEAWDADRDYIEAIFKGM